MFAIFEKAPSKETWNALIESLKVRQFTTLTAEEILEMDYMECKLLMLHNHQFYTLAVKALERYVNMCVAETNGFIQEGWEGKGVAPQFNTLDELLRDSDYFGDEYESNRCEFVRVFLDLLWDYASSDDCD